MGCLNWNKNSKTVVENQEVSYFAAKLFLNGTAKKAKDYAFLEVSIIKSRINWQ